MLSLVGENNCILDIHRLNLIGREFRHIVPVQMQLAFSFSMRFSYRFSASMQSKRLCGTILSWVALSSAFPSCSRRIGTSWNGLSDCHPIFPVFLYFSTLRMVISAKIGSISQVKHRLPSLSQPRRVVPECAKKSTTASPGLELAAMTLSIAFSGFCASQPGAFC